ncbi:MAG: hypothetical protein QG658_548 [Patescibacteria group bacterium]|jgi:lipopolysaccharide/colanic/teichoic acid biosynthesis glycosyltransferase|nr:hypothetical protein [Patescibacteria group bacterium]
MTRWQCALTWLITILLTPVIAVIIMICACLIMLVNGYAPFFRQERIGKHGRPFVCYKLQTMRPLQDGEEYLDPEHNARRSDPLGDFLRDHGIDELPQLFNVYRGEMALIGPRPLMQKNIDMIRSKNGECIGVVNCWLQHRAEWLPGITGWHQVNSSGPGIMLFDLAYVGGLPWRKYCTIVWRSLWVIPASKEQLPGHPATPSVST